jgi:integrase
MRHTWATLAAELDIPKETISAALGHGKKTVTDIYIQFDRKKIDEANRKVIDHVFYN